MGLVKSLSKNLGFLIFIYIWIKKKKHDSNWKKKKGKNQKSQNAKQWNSRTLTPYCFITPTHKGRTKWARATAAPSLPHTHPTIVATTVRCSVIVDWVRSSASRQPDAATRAQHATQRRTQRQREPNQRPREPNHKQTITNSASSKR